MTHKQRKITKGDKRKHQCYKDKNNNYLKVIKRKGGKKEKKLTNISFVVTAFAMSTITKFPTETPKTGENSMQNIQKTWKQKNQLCSIIYRTTFNHKMYALLQKEWKSWKIKRLIASQQHIFMLKMKAITCHGTCKVLKVEDAASIAL